MTTPLSARSALEQLRHDFSANPEVLAKVNGYLDGLPVLKPDAYLVEFDEQQGGELVPKRHAVLEEPTGHYLECSTPLYKEVVQPKSECVESLIKAAREVMSWTEAAHRPPVRDSIEMGRMVGVRLHALVDLGEALLALEDHVPHSDPALSECPEPDSSPVEEQANANAEADPAVKPEMGLFEATYMFEKLGYRGMDRIRETLKTIGAVPGEEPGTFTLNLESPFTQEQAATVEEKGGA